MQQLSEGTWPQMLPAVEVRMTRPTDKLDEVLEFYCGQLGAGHEPVELENPWWAENGALTFEDPDGWRIVLMPKPVPLMA